MKDKLPKPKASTQDHLDIEDILDDLVILRTGWVALVLNTTAVNFDLLSEIEQDATIYAYGAFLNSLTFPIEILIRSKKADISAYFHALSEAEKVQPNPDLKRQIQKYEDFIRTTVQQKMVLEKKFYIVITHSVAGGGRATGGGRAVTAKDKKQIIEAAKSALSPRRDHVIKQLARLGLGAKQLTSQELIELYYDIYNPAPTGTQRVILDSESYTAPMVEPAIENPSPARMEQREEMPISGPRENPGLGSGGPHAEVAVGQQESVVEVGLRPVPPRLDIGKAEESENRNIGGVGGQMQSGIANRQPVGQSFQAQSTGAEQNFNQTDSQSNALSELQKAVAAASGLVTSTTQLPAETQGSKADLGDNTGGSGYNPGGSGGVNI